MKGSKEKVVLGSGKVYTMLYTGTLPETFTEILKKVMTEENHTGWIKNGASVEYKPTMTTEKDDLGMVVKEILTDEEATFKTGLFTWNANSLAKLSATAVVTTEDGENGKKYVILFVHEDPVEGNCYLLIVGRNTAGFTITFAADSATVIDAEFNCKPHDSRGTLIEFVEEYEEEYQNEYTSEELNALTVDQIKTIAAAKGYTITKTTKAEIITEFLAAQTAAKG